MGAPLKSVAINRLKLFFYKFVLCMLLYLHAIFTDHLFKQHELPGVSEKRKTH